MSTQIAGMTTREVLRSIGDPEVLKGVRIWAMWNDPTYASIEKWLEINPMKDADSAIIVVLLCKIIDMQDTMLQMAEMSESNRLVSAVIPMQP